MIDFLHNDRSCKITGAAFVTLFLGLAPTFGGATPLGQHVRRQSNGSGATKPQVWVPIVVVAMVLVALSMMAWARRGLRRSLASIGQAAAGTTVDGDSGSGSQTREVTADQLTGRTPAATNARRPRRTRRTPSQISTASLPLYMKEPGDQELVIFRGQDPEDNPDIAVVMPPVQEDGEGHSGDASRTFVYGDLPESPQDMSLVQGDESFDPTNNRSSRQLLPPNSGNSPHRASFDTIDTTRESEESSSSLLRVVQQAGDDPRGEAPPYFEVVDSDSNGELRQGLGSPSAQRTLETSSDLPRSATIDSRPTIDPETREIRGSHRLSGFRSLLHTLTNTNPRPPVPPIPQDSPQSTSGHIRNDSSLSMTSSSTHDSRFVQTRERGGSRASHRPTTSGSGSALHSAFRTISRQKSLNTMNSGHLNSPSMISLNSISAPLTHTLTRTEISYPASGPTAEQMRLISSRESFARFAVPYGPDAIAFAASTSRHDLEPTPDYESQVPNLGVTTIMRSSPLAPVVDSPVDGTQPSSSASQSLREAPDSAHSSRDVDSNSDEPLASPTKDTPSPGVNAEPSPSPVQISPVADPVSQDLAQQVLPVTPTPPRSSFKLPSSSPPHVIQSVSRTSSMRSVTSFATAEESMYDSAPSRADSPDTQSASFHPHQNPDTTVSEGIIPVVALAPAA